MSRSVVARHERQVRAWLMGGETYCAIGKRLGVSDVAVRKQVRRWGLESKYAHVQGGAGPIRISRNPPPRRDASTCIVCHEWPKGSRGCCEHPDCQEVWRWFLDRGGPSKEAPRNRSDLIGLYALTRYIEWHASTQPKR